MAISHWHCIVLVRAHQRLEIPQDSYRNPTMDNFDTDININSVYCGFYKKSEIYICHTVITLQRCMNLMPQGT